MPTYWTIENAGVEKALPDWGLDRVSAQFNSLAPDVCSLWSSDVLFDAAYLFAFKSTVTVRRDRVSLTGLAGSFSGGSVYFTGLVAFPTLRASGRKEGQGCSIIGPWWYLDERGFKQSFYELQSWNLPSPPVYLTKYTPHIFLNNKLDSFGNPTVSKLTSGEQIVEALNWALKPFVDAAASPPFQIGTVDLAVDPPIDEVKNITCAEVIRKMCRWSPDAVSWFDYTTTPPTFHCRRRANLTASNLAIGSWKCTDVDIRPRHDLQRPFVHVQFERVNTVNGSQYNQIIEDIYPNPAPTAVIDQFAGVPIIIDLRGYVIQKQSVSIECQAIAADTRQWWLDHLPEYKKGLAENRYSTFEIDATSVRYERQDGSEVSFLPWPRELLGQAADWVNANFERINITVKARVVTKNGREHPDRTLSFALIATDAVTGTYSTDAGSSAADPIPVNLAKDLFDAVSVLPFEGSLNFQDVELGGLPRVGNTLNITGSATRPEWSTMAALVYRVSEDVFRRTTQIDFGPPAYLNAGDLVSLFMVARNRLNLNSPLMRSGGGGVVGGLGSLSKYSNRANSGNASGNDKVIVASGSTNPDAETNTSRQGKVRLHGGDETKLPEIFVSNYAGAGTISLKVGAEVGTSGQDVELRWTQGCDPVTGSPRYCVVARSVWVENLPPGAVLD